MTDIREGFTSASQAESDLLCPGRHLAQRGLTEVISPEAASGNRIHEWLAVTATGGCTIVQLSPEEMEIALACQKRALSIVDEWCKGHHFDIFTEERLWCAVQTFKHSGQPDFVALDAVEKRAVVLDFKSGRSDVPEPNTNQQLRDLAVLASIRWVLDEITVAIVQPFAKRQPPCVYSEQDIARALKDMRNRVLMSNNPMAPRVAGEKQCKWCKASRTCPQYDAWAKGALPVLANGFGIEHAWTAEQWVQFLSIAPEAEKWIESKKDEARALLRANPESIPGYELKTIEREKITNVQGVFEQTTARGVHQSAFMQAVTVTKKGLKESLRTIGLKGKELETTMDEILFGNVESKESTPMIVRKKE